MAEIEADPGAVTVATYREIGSADANADGVVDLIDFTLFQAAFLTNDTCHDLDGCDDFVNISDFTVFQSVFGSECP